MVVIADLVNVVVVEGLVASMTMGLLVLLDGITIVPLHALLIVL